MKWMLSLTLTGRRVFVSSWPYRGCQAHAAAPTKIDVQIFVQESWAAHALDRWRA